MEAAPRFTQIKVKMLPKAERDSFAVEIHLATGSSITETASVSDSLTKILLADKRVKSVTSFIGMASPRFHMTYSPEPMPTSAYAQFIVITESEKATKEIDGKSLDDCLLDARMVKAHKRHGIWKLCNCLKKQVTLFKQLNTELKVI